MTHLRLLCNSNLIIVHYSKTLDLTPISIAKCLTTIAFSCTGESTTVLFSKYSLDLKVDAKF